MQTNSSTVVQFTLQAASHLQTSSRPKTDGTATETSPLTEAGSTLTPSAVVVLVVVVIVVEASRLVQNYVLEFYSTGTRFRYPRGRRLPNLSFLHGLPQLLLVNAGTTHKFDHDSYRPNSFQATIHYPFYPYVMQSYTSDTLHIRRYKINHTK